MHLGFQPNSFGGGTHYAIGEHPQTGQPSLIVTTIFGTAHYKHNTREEAIAAGLAHIADGGWLTADTDDAARSTRPQPAIRDAVKRTMTGAHGALTPRFKTLRLVSELPGISDVLETCGRVDARTLASAVVLHTAAPKAA